MILIYFFPIAGHLHIQKFGNIDAKEKEEKQISNSIKYGKDFNERNEHVYYEMWLLTNKQTKVQQYNGIARNLFREGL